MKLADGSDWISNELTLDDYQAQAVRTLRPGMGEVGVSLAMCGEAGELANLVKKKHYHDKPIETERLADELGDVLWYVAAMAQTIGWSLEAVAEYNIRKLKERHG